jgi:hypothetical protein
VKQNELEWNRIMGRLIMGNGMQERNIARLRISRVPGLRKYSEKI